MTIKECIDIVDNAKPNQYGIKEKVMWLSFVDETIINDVLKTHEGYDGRYDDFTGYTEDKLSAPLIVPSPYDRLYPQYIKMMIDSENGETARYNNSSALYNTYLNEYKKYYNKTHMPLNATQKIPSPVSININSGLSEAQIEYIKRQLYYMLSEDFSEATSRDKLYDIVTSYVGNNLELLKAKLSMSYKGETSALPETAKIGDVYKLDTSVYRDGAYYIPIFANGSSAADGGTRYYFETIFADEIIDVVSAMVSDDRTNELAFENNESKFEMPLIRAGYENNSLYIDSTTDTNDYIDAYFTHILVPEEYGEEYFADRKAVLFNKGELVVFGENGWVSADADILKNIRYDFEDFKTEVAERFNVCDESFATVSLDNVSNEDFKAKAEEAGIGNAGLTEEKCIMEFMGEVSVLPETANDGEVYSLSPWTNVGEFFDASGNVITEHTIYFGGWSSIANFLYDDVQRYGGCTYKFIIGNREFIFKECNIASAGPDGFEMSVNCTEQGVNYTIPYNSTVEVYRTDGEPKDNDSYVRFNNKWIKL